MDHYQNYILQNGTSVKLFICEHIPDSVQVFGEAFGETNCEIGFFAVKDNYKNDTDIYPCKCIDIASQLLFLEDFIAYSPEEWTEKIARGERFTGNDLVCTILKYGVDNVKFTIPLEYVTNAPEELKKEPVVCKFITNSVMRINNKLGFHGISTYKLGFHGVYKNKEMREPFKCDYATYTSDLASFFMNGFCKFVK